MRQRGNAHARLITGLTLAHGLPDVAAHSRAIPVQLTGDARPRFFECSRSGGDAREAMTVGCKPTTVQGWQFRGSGARA